MLRGLFNNILVFAQEPILVGVPTSTTVFEGKESLKAVEMAVEEINAKGGVKIGAATRPIKIESIDIRDASPGVPVSEALLGTRKDNHGEKGPGDTRGAISLRGTPSGDGHSEPSIKSRCSAASR